MTLTLDNWIYRLITGDSLVLLESAGEIFGINSEMQRLYIELAAERLVEKTKIIVGVSGMDAFGPAKITEFAHSICEVIAISPYSFLLSEQDLQAFQDDCCEHRCARLYIHTMLQSHLFQL